MPPQTPDFDHLRRPCGSLDESSQAMPHNNELFCFGRNRRERLDTVNLCCLMSPPSAVEVYVWQQSPIWESRFGHKVARLTECEYHHRRSWFSDSNKELPSYCLTSEFESSRALQRGCLYLHIVLLSLKTPMLSLHSVNRSL